MLESIAITALVGLGSFAISSLGFAKKEKKEAAKAKAEAEKQQQETAQQTQMLQEAAAQVLNATTNGWSIIDENGQKITIPKFTIVKEGK